MRPLAILLMLAAAPATAGEWQICDLSLSIDARNRTDHTLSATVLKAQGKPGVECPPVGSSIRFRPESRDYQSELPSRQWPRTGQNFRVRYRYLDGICKDRGACRIEHYPVR